MSEKDKLPDVVSLTTLKGGVAIEMFDHQLRRLLNNIADENTEPEEARQITLKVTVKPDPDREQAVILVECKANKLAGIRSQGSTAYIGRRRGQVVAVEYDPRQADMFDPDAGADITPISDRRESNGA